MNEEQVETVTISKVEYARLVDEAARMGALRAAGVDNWEGFDEAMAIYYRDSLG